MYPNNEGPQKTMIPEQSFITCSGCKFHDHKLVRSGRDPKYRDDCTHPDNGQDKAFKLSFTGNLHVNGQGIIVTPDWCPFRNITVFRKSEATDNCEHCGRPQSEHLSIGEYKDRCPRTPAKFK